MKKRTRIQQVPITGDNNHLGSSSPVLTQTIHLCSLQITQDTDDGIGQNCGTLSAAIVQANYLTNNKTITFAPSINSINLTNNLPPIPGGIIIQGECINNNPQVTINGMGNTNGLILNGNVTIKGLYLKNFKGPAIVAKALTGSNQFRCIKVGF